ncbi:MAG: Helix-turn-helix domain [Bacteroidota bacterium]|jgi:excisionase family DNA binding protein
MSTNILIPKTDYESLLNRVSLLEHEITKLIELSQVVPEKDRYMDMKNASALLGISRASIYRIMQRGEMGYTNIGRQRRVLISDLMKYSDKKRKSPLGSIL